MARLAGILCWKDVYSEAIYQIMVAKHLIMTRSLLEKMDSEQPVQIFLLLQDEILENQADKTMLLMKELVFIKKISRSSEWK